MTTTHLVKPPKLEDDVFFEYKACDNRNLFERVLNYNHHKILTRVVPYQNANNKIIIEDPVIEFHENIELWKKMDYIECSDSNGTVWKFHGVIPMQYVDESKNHIVCKIDQFVMCV